MERFYRPRRPCSARSSHDAPVNMMNRTTSKTVTFTHPFVLDGLDGPHPAGSYAVETAEELLQALSFQPGDGFTPRSASQAGPALRCWNRLRQLTLGHSMPL
jgi:hypothetical protein